MSAAIFARLIFLAVGFLMTLSLMAWIPRQKLKFSYIGSRTLSVYVLHVIVRDILEQLHIFGKIHIEGEMLLLSCVIFCVVLTIVLSGEIFYKYCNKVFKIKYDALMR